MQTSIRLSATLVLMAAGCYDPYPAPAQSAPGFDDHPAFPIDSGAHKGVDCNACHGAFSSFTQFACTGCHEHNEATMAAVHQGVRGYLWDAAACYGCHPTGQGMSREQHTAFPIVAGNHRAVACADCHPLSYDAIACFDCHTHTCAITAPRHEEVGNFSCDSQRCYQCHPSGSAED